MKLEVTFITKTNHEIKEIFDSTKGSTVDYKLRALALGWIVKSVTKLS